MMRPLGGAAIAFLVSPASVASTTWKASALGFLVARSKRDMRSTCSAPRRWNTHQPASTTMTRTAAVTTARELFISPASLPSFFYGCARFARGFAALDGLALVVRLLALCEADRDLHAPVLQVHADGHDRHAALGRLPNQLADLLPVQQQLAPPLGIVI